MMSRISIVFVAAILASSKLAAAPAVITVSNMSSESITLVSATPKDAPAETAFDLLSTSISPGGTADAQVDLAGGQCVYNLVFTFASGRAEERPDTDLCQTEGIVVE